MKETPTRYTTETEIDAEIDRLSAIIRTDPGDAEEIERQILSLTDLKLAMIDRETGHRAAIPTMLAAASHRGEHRHRRLATDAYDGGRAAHARASKKSRSHWRRDKRRDDEIYKYIIRLLREKQPVRLTPRLADTVRSADLELASARLSETRCIPKIGLPHWDHTDPLLRMLGWSMASWDLNATPFTLRLNADLIRKAQADSRGMSRHLQDRISRHLRSRLGASTPFWFVIETSVMGECHLHGAVVIPPGQKDAVEAALKAAGGPWGTRRQLALSERGDPAKWIGYCTKWFYGSKAKVRDEATTAATNDIRRLAREWHQKARRDERVIYPI